MFYKSAIAGGLAESCVRHGCRASVDYFPMFTLAHIRHASTISPVSEHRRRHLTLIPQGVP